MRKRITCISLLDKESINRIEHLVKKFDGKLCKVPYLEENRQSKDTLPYHITLQSWNESEKETALHTLKQIEIKPIILNMNSINIKNSHNNTYNVYLGIEKDEQLLNIYKQFYKITQNTKYNPETFIPHITLHCDENYDYIINIKKSIEKNFKQFEIAFREIGLYEIYPAKRLK